MHENIIGMTLATRERNTAFDFIKCIAAFLVVCIHYAPRVSICDMYFNAICRVGVPLFFIITGYYYDSIKESNKLESYIFKIIRLTFISSLFYFIVYAIEQCIWGDFIGWFYSVFTCKNVFLWFLFNSFPVVYHLWYLYALIYALLANVIVDKLKLTGYMPYVAIGLLILDAFLLYDAKFNSLYVRNWLMMGFPFIIIGRTICREQSRIKCMNCQAWFFNVILALSIVLLFVEQILLQRNNVPVRDLYVCVIPIVVIITILAIRNPSFGAKSFVAQVGKFYSNNIYIYHIFLGSLILSQLPKSTHIMVQYIIPLLVFSISLLFSILVKYVMQRGREHKLSTWIKWKKI